MVGFVVAPTLGLGFGRLGRLQSLAMRLCLAARRRVFRYPHLTRGARKSADVKGSIADPTSASFAVPQRGKLVWWRGGRIVEVDES